jgi:hypothetical protein
MTCRGVIRPQLRLRSKEERILSLRKRRFTRSTGVTLEVAVLEYLRDLAENQDRDRSFCINQIVREHAERNGRPLRPATQPPDPAPPHLISIGALNRVS